MIHTIPLPEFPSDLEVPDNLKERFWYDADRKCLCFDGFMSKATFDRLEILSQNGQYQHALEDLFRVCVPEDEQAGWRARKTVWFAALTLALVTLGGLVVWCLVVVSG